MFDATVDQAAIILADVLVPGVGPVVKTLALVRQVYVNMKESTALCECLESRLSATWARLLKMEQTGTLPPTFKVADFTDILARFHTLVLKQAQKSFVVRVGTSVSFMKKLQMCQEDLDALNDSFRDQATEMLLQWRVDWERNVLVMQKEIAQVAAPGVAARMVSSSVAESTEALVVLTHEQEKVVDNAQIIQALQAICYQLARDRKLVLPTNMPPWFFTFDDVDIEREPLHGSSSTSMGTVHRAKWGTHTNVIVKKITLPVPPKSSAVVTWKEAEVWWKLNHPNVVHMYGACHVTTPAFIVCEEAKNGNIREYLAANPQHRQQFWRLQLDVAIGLVHLKNNHVVHGNLKLNNILVGDDGRAKITDFGFSYIRDTDSFVENDTMMTNDSDEAAVAPYAPSWPAPELRAAAERGDRMLPSYESDVYAFAVCMMQLLTDEDPRRNQHALARLTLQPKRPPGIGDDGWDLIRRMCTQDPTARLTITQVQTRLQRLAEKEATGNEVYSMSTNSSQASSHDVDTRREAYQQQRNARGGTVPGIDHTQRDHLQRELEVLRQKIRDEERELERLIDKKQRTEAAAAKPSTREDSTTPLSSTLTTKELLRILRWGTTTEQTQALLALDANRVQHSAHEIVRNNGLDIIVACMKHGHSSEFRHKAIDILQSIATAGVGVYQDVVLDHSVTQILMGILHYRRVATEQRRAGQLLVLLSTKSARPRLFFLQNSGLELLIKVLWQEQLPLFDRDFKAQTHPDLVEEMRSFLATHADARMREGDYAMNQTGNLDLALQKYAEAMVLNPRNDRIFAKRSAVYAALRKFEYAAKDAQQCIRLQPQFGGGYFRHAIALYELKKVEQADHAVREGRKKDELFFTPERMYELALHAPRGREKDNPKAWGIGTVRSVEL